ncbi:MAG: hypothetical protein WA192_15295 [Candidatus Acidiferrales bacterium]
MRKTIHLLAVLAIALVVMLTMSACGGGGSSTPTVNDLVVVPGTASVPLMQQAQFSAFLNGVGTSSTWTASSGTIDGTGLFTAPNSPGSVTITATSGSNTGTATVQVVATSQTLVVNPAALAIPAGGPQSFTATPSAGVTWSVNGFAGGDCVAPTVGSTTQCHGVIDGDGNYTAPLSPPTGGTVTISASGGGSSATAAATILFSAASLTTNPSGTGQYAVAFTGSDFTEGLPLYVAGTIATSGAASSTQGTITGGEMDINSQTAGIAIDVPVLAGGSFQVGALDGRTSILVTLASNNITTSFTLQATLASNQHALLIDFDTFATASGTLDAENTSSFATPLNGNFAFQYFGDDLNYFNVTAAGTFVIKNNSIPINPINAPVNVQDLEYSALSTPVVTNDISLTGSYSGPPDNFGRGQIFLTSTTLGTVGFAYYMIDQTHLKLVEIDPTQNYVLSGEVFSAPLATTPLTGGVAMTFGGAANNSPYGGGAIFAISSNSVSPGGALDVNNGGASATQINNPITTGAYSSISGSGNVPGRYQLSLTTSKGTVIFSAYTFVTASGTGAELVEIDTNNGVQGSSGVAYQRGSVSTVQGSFALNLSGVGLSKNSGAFEQDTAGQIGLTTNSTAVSGTLDINNGGPYPGLPLNSTSIINAVASNGRGTAQLNVSSGVSAKFSLVYYQIDSNTELLFDADSNRVATGILIRQF